MLLGCVGVELFAQPLAGLFSLSATTHAMCVDCMRIVSLGFLFAGLCIAFQGVFQALECGVEVAAGPGRSHHTGSGAGAVPEAGEKTDRFLKKAAGGTTSDGFCIG